MLALGYALVGIQFATLIIDHFVTVNSPYLPERLLTWISVVCGVSGVLVLFSIA